MTQLKANKRFEITCNIPGGWYGNDPGTWTDPFDQIYRHKGNVVVDVGQIAAAIDYLRQRRWNVVATKLHSSDGGILIQYERAARPASKVAA